MLAASVLAAALAACSDSTDPDADPLPDNAGTAVGLTVRDNVESSLDAFFPPRLLQLVTRLPSCGEIVHKACNGRLAKRHREPAAYGARAGARTRHPVGISQNVS
jgi:hypothetical protein